MRMRIGAVTLCLLLVTTGCAKPTAPSAATKTPSSESSSVAETTPNTNTSTPPAIHPTAPVAMVPRLLLDLALGDEPNQPGNMPGRVGGVSPRGPVGFAAGWGEIFLVDQAKGRVLRYHDGQLADSIPVPWLDEQANGLRMNPFGLVLNVSGTEYTVASNGQLVDIRPLSDRSTPGVEQEKGTTPLGKDGKDNLYERAIGDRGPIARRVSKDGSVLAVANLDQVGEIHDWYMGRDGSLYAMTWQWGQERIDRVKVYEIFPTVTFSSPPGGVDPASPPTVAGRPIPSRIRLHLPDWAPLEVKGEVDRWNLWWLLATAIPISEPTTEGPGWAVSLEADFPDGSMLTLAIKDANLTVDGKRYHLGAPGALHSLVDGLRFSEQGITGAIDAAQRVRIAIEDLPGVEKELSLALRQQLRESLSGVMPVNLYTPPQPLEPPFPQYAIKFQGAGWERTLLLVGNRHLVAPSVGAALHSGRTADLVKGWLPVPALQPDEVGDLYLADRLAFGQGADLTRWKDTVVRQLIHARVDADPRPGFPEPFTLTFWVKGQARTVEVDKEGFTYAGKRYPGSGLTGMAYMQGVP